MYGTNYCQMENQRTALSSLSEAMPVEGCFILDTEKPKRHPTMKTLFSSLVLLILSSVVSAQDLHVYCDAFTDSVWYVRSGRSVMQAEVKAGQTVIFHLVNFNHYLYEAQLEVEEQRIRLADRSGGGSALSGLSALSPISLLLAPGGGGSGLAGIPFLTGLDGMTMGFASQTDESEKIKAEHVSRLHTDLRSSVGQLARFEEQITLAEEQLRDAEYSLRKEMFAAEELQRVPLNPHLAPAQIKDMAREYALVIFGTDDPDQITLDGLLTRKSPVTDMVHHVASYREALGQYTFHLKAAQALFEELNQYSIPGTNLRESLTRAQQTLQLSEEREAVFRKNVNELENQIPQMKGLESDQLTKLRHTYLVLIQHDFTRTFRHVAETDVMLFRVTLKALDQAKEQGVYDRDLAPIRVRSYGGLKFNTSVGLGFGQTFKQPYNYFVRDSTVRRSRSDAFVPMVSSFLNFYYLRPAAISWGGSIGAGLPISGGDGFQSINFFLGPSMIIGPSGRIVFTTGIMGGRIATPAQGYQAGDVFPGDPGLFKTENAYELGYFVSITFNLISN
jgi:hypothetical protein